MCTRVLSSTFSLPSLLQGRIPILAQGLHSPRQSDAGDRPKRVVEAQATAVPEALATANSSTAQQMGGSSSSSIGACEARGTVLS